MSASAPWHLRSLVRSSEEEIWNQTTFAQFRIGKYPLYRWRCMIIFRKIWSTLTNGTLIIIPWCTLKKICSQLERRRRIKEKKHTKYICFLLSSFTLNLSHRVFSWRKSTVVTHGVESILSAFGTLLGDVIALLMINDHPTLWTHFVLHWNRNCDVAGQQQHKVNK